MTGGRGEIHEGSSGERTLVLRRVFREPIGEVWSALSEPDRLARWFGSYTGTGGAGGTVELTVTGEVDAGGEVAAPVTVTVLECDPPHRLVVDIPEAPGRAWRVATTLTEGPDGTHLVFEQRIADGLDAVDVEAGWRWYLDRLAAAVHDEPMPAWADYAPVP